MGIEKPGNVRKAMLDGDAAALRAMQAKSVSHRVQTRDFKKAANEQDLQEHLANQAKIYRLDENGDVLPPDEIVPLS